jgi:hypothetical protein
MRNCILVLAIALGLQPGPGLAAASSPPVDTERLAQLISKLGSAKFQERETATQALQAMGGPALEALQRAALSSDPEVGRRAQNLAHAVRRQIETAQFLAPLRIRLVYHDTPIPQALDDFAKKTGFPIALQSAPSRLANRRITLDTGETSFWEAFQQFCEKAGLIERTASSDSDLQVRHLLETTRMGPRGIAQIVDLPSSTLNSLRSWDGRLTLVDGQPKPLPTYHAGTVRIRALPSKGIVPDTAKDEVLFLMEITPQPKAAWHNVVDLRIDKALDANGHDLASILDTRTDLNQLAALGNGAMLWDSQTGQPLTACRDLPVRLKGSEKPSGVLKELTGIIAAQVQTPPQTIITVENILKSAGRTFAGEDGQLLKLVEVGRQDNGDVRLRIDLTDFTPTNTFWAMRGGVMRPNRPFRRALAGMESTSPANLLLQDANGQSFPQRSRDEAFGFNGDTVTRCIVSTYHSGLGEPSKLIYSGRRTILIEIPFTLKDVPLP